MELFDIATEKVQQGGMRRGANMAILNVDHPDIEEFITAKQVDGKLTNFNLSVGITDAFMKRLQMERTLELCFEGWRWADLKRWGLLDNQAGIDELKARDADFNNFVLGKHKRLPIPQIEIDNSVGGLKQNPMY